MRRFEKDGKCDVFGVDLPLLNVEAPFDVQVAVESYEPDVVVHCAARTDVDGCQADPVGAMAANWVGTANVAVACAMAKSKMVYVSTSFVFDGKKPGSYVEWDETGPLGVYGLSKLKGEEAVRAHCPNHVILRTTWLYGDEGKGFPERVVEMARAGKPLTVVGDQRGDPTSATALADAIWWTCEARLAGTFHASCSGGGCAKHELAVAALQAARASAEVVPISTAEYVRDNSASAPGVVSPRPRNSCMDGALLARTGWALPHWRDEIIRRFSGKSS